MKILTTLPAILILLLCTSANPVTNSKSISNLDPNACACYQQLIVNNSGGARIITHARIEWPGFVQDWYPSICPGCIQVFGCPNPGNSMHYPVKVTLWWGPLPAVGPKLKLYANPVAGPQVLIGNFSTSATVSTAVVNGTLASGPGTDYCYGVTVVVTEII
jgi:hypothetical protein